MSNQILGWVIANYQWKLSALTLAGILGVQVISGVLGRALVPAFGEAARVNKADFARKMEKPAYAENQAWNRRWALAFLTIIFAGIMPFCVTLAPQPIWKMALDCVIILMFYDFFYYLTHRFLFHDSGFFGGPLKWMHAVHHRQHNPNRNDSSYIHPLEVAIGLGLYVASIFVLARFLGTFHVGTIVLTWTAFQQINLHNHTLWSRDSFPFRYLNHVSFMHHNHHAKFTGGNYATITLLYDWMFGTLDYGDDHTRKVRARAAAG